MKKNNKNEDMIDNEGTLEGGYKEIIVKGEPETEGDEEDLEVDLDELFPTKLNTEELDVTPTPKTQKKEDPKKAAE